MNKGLLRAALLSVVCASMPAAMTSCKDYDDDINNLQSQIDALRVDVDKLVGLIESGKVITDVKTTSNGVVFTLSDGKDYTITNGKDGANGTNGTAWTIGTDGYWYKDGAKTDYRAIGEQGAVGPQGPKGDKGETGATGATGAQGPAGATGPQGPQGPAGNDGQNGEYYVPNAETGYFDIYRDGKKIGTSDIMWRATAEDGSVTAAFTGNKLTLAWKNEKGEVQTVEVQSGAQIGTIAFIPSVLSGIGGYATTDQPFYYINSYLSESKYNTSTKEFIPQTEWNKSSIVALEYRVSPENAYIATGEKSAAMAAFLGREVTSRAYAEGDIYNNCVMGVNSFDPTTANGTGLLPVTAFYNKLYKSKTQDDIVAFRLINGQSTFTSDYIAPDAKAITPVIVNPKDNARVYAARTKAIVSNGETDAFVKEFMPLTANYDIPLNYKESINLLDYVALYSTALKEYLGEDSKIKFEDITYKFSMPKEYNATDTQKTNQQWFATAPEGEAGTISVNSTNVPDLTPAIDRTPVYRVDAFMADNMGNGTQLVASAYIKVKIVRETPKPQEPADDIENVITNTVPQIDYHKLTASQTKVAEMSWQDVNNKIYGAAGLTALTFWNNYGGTSDNYTVEISSWKNGKEVLINKDNTTATAGTTFTLAQDGLFCNIKLDKAATQTSNIRFDVNNKVHTENYYDAFDITVNGQTVKAAKYTVKITIPVDKSYSTTRGDIILTQDFYVYEICPEYAYNPLYYNKDLQALEVIGRVVGTGATAKWEMSANIGQLFENQGTTAAPVEIFSYFNKGNNATAITFTKLSPANTEVTFSNNTIALAKAIKDQVTATMKYTLTLQNGETCEKEFKVVFTNPFTSQQLKGVSFNGNTIGLTQVETADQVKVIDTNNDAIYAWSTTAKDLALSQLAKYVYILKESDVTVTYAFLEDAAYKTFKTNMDPASTLSVNGEGQISYDNKGGAKLQDPYTLTVIASVKFGNVSIVDCKIPVLVRTTAE